MTKEQLEAWLENHSSSTVYTGTGDERLKVSRSIHAGEEEIKQLLSDCVDHITPKQLTEADNLDFTLYEAEPKGNCYYAYNCAVAEVKKAKKDLGL
jgi:hypothetical protein